MASLLCKNVARFAYLSSSRVARCSSVLVLNVNVDRFGEKIDRLSPAPRRLLLQLSRPRHLSTEEKKLGESESKKEDGNSDAKGRENILTVPNLLSTLRIALSPYIGYLILQQSFYPAIALFLFCGATDSIDGYIARNFPGQQSVLGSVLDPLGDKLMVGIMAGCLAYTHLLPWQLLSVILFKDVGLILASGAVRYQTLEAPKTVQRYFDLSHATVQFKPNTLGKLTTFLQILAITSSLAAPVCSFVDHPLLQGLWWVTGIATTSSMLSYLPGTGFKRLTRKR